jgi:hypothetical protein
MRSRHTSAPPNAGAGTRGRAVVNAASSLATIRARIAELQLIVAHPEIYLADMTLEQRTNQVIIYRTTLARLHVMAAAKENPTTPGAHPRPAGLSQINQLRATAKVPYNILGQLRIDLLANLDRTRAEAREASARNEVITDTEHPLYTQYDALFSTLAQLVNQAHTRLREHVAANLDDEFGFDEDEGANAGEGQHEAGAITSDDPDHYPDHHNVDSEDFDES